MAPTLAPRRSVLRGDRGKSVDKPSQVSHLTDLLVLRGSRGKSARFSSRIKHLPRLLVLRGDEQDSAEMAEEIGPDHAERVLSEIPRQVGKRRGEY